MEYNKMEMKSFSNKNYIFEAIQSVFPNCIEGKTINERKLIEEIKNNNLELENRESYSLMWPGKVQAKQEFLEETTSTLRPLKSKSLDFDSTHNIYIEGDNLEVLKVIQNSYLHKIKVIYIDPPYNRGSDLIYKDNFHQSDIEELQSAELIDDDGNRLVNNPKTEGKFHSKWLTMMYSRLKVARNFLTDDGTIFISIDDNEIGNLKLICDEIFGANSFITAIPRICSYQRSGQEAYMNVSHDYILCYSYNYDFNNVIKRELNDTKIREDKNGKYIEGDTKAILAAASQGYSKGGDYDFEYNGKLYKPIDSNGNRNRWLWTKDRMEAAAKLGILVETGNTLRMQLYLDKRFEEGTNKLIDKDDKLKFHTADFMKEKFDNPIGTKELKNLFDGKEYFDNPKPVRLIKYLINLASDKNDIILDFFSGSATTGQAVLELNKEDNGNRKYILVQVGQKIDYNEQAYKDGYKYIYDVAEERLRRVKSRVIKDENLDCGFRVYKVDSSNMKDVYYAPTDLKQSQLNMFESNIKEDRSAEDLLTQVILDLGLTLDLSIEEKKIINNNVYFVESNSLVACFDDIIDINIIDEICKSNPLKIVFKESSFKTDSDKINTFERIKKLSSETEINII